ncbi:MAG: vacuolar iron transporter family protein [Patescibacteria group bacterium]|jgi:predicted membrane protein (TIGR00267 family)|nr:vacuolar iron transporter family protein [Patescibacteria group bacterium]
MQGGKLREKLVSSIREVVFGLEDSLVSTLGTVSGVAVGSGDKYVVVLSGVVLVFVEAVSMAAGSYLSSKSTTQLYSERAKQDESRLLSERITDDESLKELFERKGFSPSDIKVAMTAFGKERKLWLEEVRRCEYRFSPAVSSTPIFSAIVMGLFYVAGGFLVLAPYILLPLTWALPVAVLLTVVCLFFLGVWKANLTGVPKVRSGVEMLMVSLGAALLGILLGRLLSDISGYHGL